MVNLGKVDEARTKTRLALRIPNSACWSLYAMVWAAGRGARLPQAQP